eukprot:scaffold903_cov262-Pinguiococcus_pyrenoidosus.AAC.3
MTPADASGQDGPSVSSSAGFTRTNPPACSAMKGLATAVCVDASASLSSYSGSSGLSFASGHVPQWMPKLTKDLSSSWMSKDSIGSTCCAFMNHFGA